MSRILGLLKMSPLRSHAGARFLRFLLRHLKKKKKKRKKDDLPLTSQRVSLPL